MAYDKVIDSAKLDAELKKIADALDDKGICPSAINCTLNTETGSNGFYDIINGIGTQGGSTITPSTSAQTAVASRTFVTGAITVAAMPKGAVRIPPSYPKVTPGLSYNNGVITASVLDHSISLTPEVTTAGYVTNSDMTAQTVYLQGSNTISDSNLVSENVKNGVNIFGITGTYSGESSGETLKYGERLTQLASDYAGGTVTYRMKLLEDGYWESTNKGVKSSYSMGRFSFEVYETCNVTFEVINYAESNYDYAVFSQLDTYLAASTSADSSAYKNYKGSSSSAIQELTYSNVSPGTHFISVKFIKDSSGDTGNDSVRFRLKSPTSSSLELKLAYGDRDILPKNIKAGVSIYGIEGTYTGEPVDSDVEVIQVPRSTSKTVTISDIYYSSSGGQGVYNFIQEDVSRVGYFTTAKAPASNGFTITASNNSASDLGLIVIYYTNYVNTKMKYYKVNIV